MNFLGRTITRVDSVDPTGKYTKDYLERATAEGIKLAAANQVSLQEAGARIKRAATHQKKKPWPRY